MITLSIRQPWAWLILRPDLTDPVQRAVALEKRRIKDIENRCWSTPRRGEVLIHAGKELDKAALTPAFRQDLQRRLEITLPQPEELQTGGIVGKTNITACVTESDSPWFFGEYGFVLEGSKPLPFMPCPGKLQFFDTDYRLQVPA
jgi:hypothetical protein